MADLETSHATIDHTGITGVGGASSTAAMNQLGSDQAVVQNVWKDGPSLSLLAGTYVLTANLTVLAGQATGHIMGARLSDGTTHLASTEEKAESSGGAPVKTFSLTGYVVVGSTTTWKAQAITNGASGATIKAACTTNASGNTASTLVALKIA